MDLKKVSVVLFMTIFSSFGQEDHKFLVEFKLSLREEKIPSIVNYLLNNSLEVHDIKTEDIIKLSKLDQYNYDSVVQVFNYFNISIGEAFTVGNLEKLLTLFDIEFADFFRNFTSKLQLGTEQTEQIIRDLSIPESFWVGFSLNKKDRIYASLREGIYDEEHVSAALKTAAKTRNEVYNAARDIIKVKVLELNSTTFMGILKEQGWDRKVALRMYQALNITTSDVYKVEKFRSIFDTIVQDLNANQTLGVFVGPNQLAVHNLVYQTLLQKVDGVGKIEAGGVEVTLRKNSSLGEKIVELISVLPGSDYIDIVQNYTGVANCTYVWIKKGLVTTAVVEVVGLRVKKSASSELVLGSPLICDGKLYGLASYETDTEIIFDGFYTEESPAPPEPDDFIEESRAHLLSSPLGSTLVLIALLCTL